jgi:hypothetical protein
LAVVRLTSVQVTKLPLKHKMRKISVIFFAKPVLKEEFYIGEKEEFCSNMLYVRYIHFMKGNFIFSSEGMLQKDYYCKGSVEKINAHGSQMA